MLNCDIVNENLVTFFTTTISRTRPWLLCYDNNVCILCLLWFIIISYCLWSAIWHFAWLPWLSYCYKLKFMKAYGQLYFGIMKNKNLPCWLHALLRCACIHEIMIMLYLLLLVYISFELLCFVERKSLW